MAMTLDEIFSGIGDSIANARPDVQRERAGLLEQLKGAIAARELEKTMAVLERLDIVDHYPAIRQADGTLAPQPMPGGWTSWYGWMKQLKAYEEAPYVRRGRAVATPDIPEDEIKKGLW